MPRSIRRVAGAVFFFVYLLLGTREGKVTLGFALIMVAAAVFERAFLSSQLSYFGGLSNPALRGNQLRAVRMGILLIEGLQLAAGMILALLLIGRQHGDPLRLRDRLLRGRHGQARASHSSGRLSRPIWPPCSLMGTDGSSR